MKLIKIFSLFASLILIPSAFAHHSFQATYDMDSMIEIKGKLIQMNFRNPHASIMVMAPDEDGNMQRWGVEWGGATLLMRQGLTRTSFKPGDEVIITGQPSRDRSDFRMRMESILRPADGFGWGFDEDQTFD
ncbi:MAG: hypothetical protein HOH14_04910 [Gammaproteobacteria bacterium]|jgi:hypothetical protein|nr:hypothetical protein [Gammaproteobacteria bacterium]MBT6042815.1 hypothetical protein [Gammaproteobacteria bacterium]